MNPDVSECSCWIHRTVYKWESHCVHRILVSGLPGLQLQWVVDCNLLVDLWSENQNELCQL